MDVIFIEPWPEHVERMRKHALRVTRATDVAEFSVPMRALHVTDVQQFAKQTPVDSALVCNEVLRHGLDDQMIQQYLTSDGYVVAPELHE
ncbi:hypothetical protein [Bradyrhizobium sp. ARR65]|uniref:hypothetical protein n=1 Tax=Bradyrhizobium sp. ARR65 TaxID=1040989 RepID=UPI00046768FD|nr:hypothetical protein [Bradyrhizobium sp. ARR65]